MHSYRNAVPNCVAYLISHGEASVIGNESTRVMIVSRPCDLYLIAPHFYIANWGLQGYTLFFSFF